MAFGKRVGDRGCVRLFLVARVGALVCQVLLAAVTLINHLPPPALLPFVPALLPVLRQASGDVDEGVREAAADAIRR